MTQMQRIRPLSVLLNKGREGERRGKGKTRRKGKERRERRRVKIKRTPTSTGQPGPGEGHSDISCTSVANKVLCLELRTEPGQDGEEVTDTLFM